MQNIADRMMTSLQALGALIAERLPYVLLGTLVFLVALWVSRLVTRAAQSALGRTSTEGHVDLIVAKFAGWATLLVGILLALGVMGVSVSALAASLGLVSIAVGFALKDVIANSVSGVLLLMQRPFTVGDDVKMTSVEGVVRDIRVRDTLVEAGDGVMVYVPNATVFSDTIHNRTTNPLRRLHVRVVVERDLDLTEATATLADTLASAPGVLDVPDVTSRCRGLGEADATLSAHGWVDTAQTSLDDVLDVVVRSVGEAFPGATVSAS